jgi:hypothetical protein
VRALPAPFRAHVQLQHSSLLFPAIAAGLPLLVRTLRKEVISIGLKEPVQPLRVPPRDVVKGQGRDVVGLAFAYQRVVLEETLLFGLVALGVGVERLLCFGSIVRMGGKGGGLARP